MHFEKKEEQFSSSVTIDLSLENILRCSHYWYLVLLYKHTYFLTRDDASCQVLLSFSLVTLSPAAHLLFAVYETPEWFTVSGSDTNYSYIACEYNYIYSYIIYSCSV